MTGDEKAAADYAVIAAQQLLEATKEQYNLSGLTLDNYLEQLAIAQKAGMSTDMLAEYEEVGSALLDVAEAQKALLDIQKDALNEQYDFYQSILGKIQDAYTGSLSYLTEGQKAEYSARQAEAFLQAGDTDNYLSSLAEALESQKKISVTKEDYIPYFEDYIRDLSEAKPDATTSDVVESLQDIYDKIDVIGDAITQASLQP